MEKKENNNKKEMDVCVLCGTETKYPKNMHIDFRDYYVEGAGQLCEKCYDNVYNEKSKV